MNAYKHLDCLCRDINGIGVSGYIDEMKRTGNGAMKVPGWNKDYYALKHCRWVRNRIAHEEGANESNTCEKGDLEFVEDFYNRILSQQDPLSLYRKCNQKPKSAFGGGSKQVQSQRTDSARNKMGYSIGCGGLLSLLLALCLVVVFFVMIMRFVFF